MTLDLELSSLALCCGFHVSCGIVKGISVVAKLHKLALTFLTLLITFAQIFIYTVFIYFDLFFIFH